MRGDWAKREFEIACNLPKDGKYVDEFYYDKDCYESAYKAFQCLMKDGHNGANIHFTGRILNRLIEGKPLSPIEDVPESWGMMSQPILGGKKVATYQCNRMSSLFKDVYEDGTVKYHDTDRVICVYDGNKSIPWRNGFISRLIHEKYPITMPYYPESNPYEVHCSQCLSDPNNGDYDTIAIWYVITPYGDKNEINRFFKESSEGWKEIKRAEYFDRMKSKNNEQ